MVWGFRICGRLLGLMNGLGDPGWLQFLDLAPRGCGLRETNEQEQDGYAEGSLTYQVRTFHAQSANPYHPSARTSLPVSLERDSYGVLKTQKNSVNSQIYQVIIVDAESNSFSDLRCSIGRSHVSYPRSSSSHSQQWPLEAWRPSYCSWHSTWR